MIKIRLRYEEKDLTLYQTQFTGPSRTKQSFRNETDVNSIMAKFHQTGELPGLINSNPRYGDFSTIDTYQDSLNTVMLAQDQFAALPSLVRERFHNNPAEFLEFATNKTNNAEMAKMGLTKKTPTQPSNTASNKTKIPESKTQSKSKPSAGGGPDA
jgi:phage internal scaffolding protein